MVLRVQVSHTVKEMCINDSSKGNQVTKTLHISRSVKRFGALFDLRKGGSMQLPAEMLLVRCPDADLFERRSCLFNSWVIDLGPSTLMALTACSALMQTSIYHNHFLKLVVDTMDLPRIKNGTGLCFQTCQVLKHTVNEED